MTNNHSQYLDPNHEALMQIKHIVVLMLENRSFDNLLGWLYEGESPPRGQQFEGLNWSLANPLSNIDGDGNPFTEMVAVRQNGESYRLGRKTMPGKEDFTLPDPDPGEGYRDATHQLYHQYTVDDYYPPEPTMQGFVDNYVNAMLYGTLTFQDAPTDPREIMTTYRSNQQVPVLSTLAKQYAVCDQYFCSVPSQTLPNRAFIHAATSCGYTNNKPDNVYDVRTIYNQFQEAIDDGRSDLSWVIYSGTQRDKKSGKWEPFSLTRLCMKQIQGPKFDDNFKEMGRFYQDAADGNLPSYAFLEPQFSGPGQNDQHPPSDIRAGDKLIADVYNALRDSPQWANTLFIITYDEHGGCYDHFPPSATAEIPDQASEREGQFGFRFNRFGVRVPTVIVSPLIEAGTIARPSGWTPYDHTSVIRTAQICFDLKGSLTKRDAAAPDLSGVLTLDQPRTDKPVVEPLDHPKPESNGHVNNLHQLAAEMLAAMTGRPHPSDDEIHDFIHDAYQDVFHTQRSRRKRSRRRAK